MFLKFKMPSFNQWVQSFKAFSLGEKIIFFSFLILFLSSLIFLTSSFYNKNTVIVPAFGGSFTEGMVGQPQHINPIYSSVSDIDREVVELIYSGLLKYGKNGVLENDLIENYSFSEDGKILDFKIKENILWHDKKSLTMDDVVFTLNIIQDPEYLSPLRANFQGVTLEKMSDFEGRFKLSEAYGGFLENLTSLKVIPKHVLENIPAQNFASDRNINVLSPIGSGPYKIYKVKENGSIRSIYLRANENYFNERPNIKEIIFNFYSSEKDIEDALARGKIDNAHLASDINYNNISYITPNYFGLFLNTKNELLENIEIREAIANGINREEFLNINQKIQLTASPTLPYFYGFKGSESSYDLEKSIELLESNDFELNENNERLQKIEKVNNNNINQDLAYGDEGSQVKKLQECLSNFPEIYPSQKITSYFGNETKEAVIKFQEAYADEILAPNNLSKGNGKVGLSTRTKLNNLCFKGESTETKLEFNLKTTNYSTLPLIAENIKEQLGKLGIKVTVETFDNNQIKQVIRERNYDMLLFGEKLTSMPNLLPYWHSTQIFDPGLNLSMWQNEDSDSLLEKIRVYYDLNDDLIADLKEFENIFFEENPAIILFSPNYTYYFNDKIKGIEGEKLISSGERFNNIENWYIKTKRIWK